MAEQRRSQRFELKLPVELVRTGGRDVREISETRNVSSGGVLFNADSRLEVGEPIEYFLTLPSDQRPVRLRCMGKVLRTQRAPMNGSAAAVAATLERYEFIRG